jgi:hypothetical protein
VASSFVLKLYFVNHHASHVKHELIEVACVGLGTSEQLKSGSLLSCLEHHLKLIFCILFDHC